MLGAWRILGALATGLALSGCGEEDVSDGAIVRAVWATRSNGTTVLGGGECTNVRTSTSQDITGSYSGEIYAFRTKSSGGSVTNELFIWPQGATKGSTLTADNGELARTFTFKRESFKSNSFDKQEVPTHDGELITVAHWFEEDCRSVEVPAGLEIPKP